MSSFNEATRVQMPAMMHLTRLGYEYLGKISEEDAGTVYDLSTNILIDVFTSQFTKLNPNYTGSARQIIQDIRNELKNDDLGFAFYQRLKAISPVKLIDYEVPSNNRFHFTEQATQEFEARGLVVTTANSRKELMDQFRNNQSQQGASGRQEITVVNIQRFAEDKEKVKLPEYATNLQRVFILDEAHRGYRPGGCFLANLFDADPNSIKIALTGTPLLKEEKATANVFNEYFHTYYYDRSIADGYTLKIIREEIETSYKERLQTASP